MDPIYTPDNCTPAFQLRWTLALFPNGPLPQEDAWLSPLKAAVERDAVRILETHRRSPSCWQFLLSTHHT